MQEECAAVEEDYDQALDDDLEADLFQVCTQSCSQVAQSKREELSVDLCLRKLISYTKTIALLCF